MRLCMLVLLIPLTLGCGGGLERFPTAQTYGRVLCDGKPLANMRVYFAPIGGGNKRDSGKAGEGHTDESGAFTISTYGKEDGAVVGKHRVTIDTPHPEDHPDFKCDCETNPKVPVKEVEIVAGVPNNFEFELPLKKDKSAPNISPKTLEDIKASKEGT